MMSKDQIERRRATRIRKVVLNAMGRFVLFPGMIFGGLWMLAVVAVMHALRPDLDTNGWPFLLRGLPIWMVLLWLTIYALLAVEVRLMLRRKGAQRTVRYLFPEVLSGTESRVDRISFWALGIRCVIRDVRGGFEASYERDNQAG
jgi:hypothetical protein